MAYYDKEDEQDLCPIYPVLVLACFGCCHRRLFVVKGITVNCFGNDVMYAFILHHPQLNRSIINNRGRSGDEKHGEEVVEIVVAEDADAHYRQTYKGVAEYGLV